MRVYLEDSFVLNFAARMTLTFGTSHNVTIWNNVTSCQRFAEGIRERCCVLDFGIVQGLVSIFTTY